MEPIILSVTLLGLGLVAVLAPRFGADSRHDEQTWPGTPASGTLYHGC